MAITAERLAQGMTYADYKAQMTCNRERLEAHERAVVLAAEDVAFFARLPRPLHVLVLTEDWCEPAIAAVPVLACLAAAGGTLDVRLFPRDRHPDLMDQYLNDGVHRTIPTFVFLDQELRELGRWVERPARIAELGHAMLRDLFAHDPVLARVPAGTPPDQLPEAARRRLMEAFARFGDETRELFEHELVREIRALVERPTGTQGGPAEHAQPEPEAVA